MGKSGTNTAVREINFDNNSYESLDYYSSTCFEPDIILPTQFFDHSKNGLSGGERKLMSALLSDGVQGYIEQALSYLSGFRGRIDAIEWVESKDNNYIFSFDNVCHSLSINPEYLRLGLAKLVLESKRTKSKKTDYLLKKETKTENKGENVKISLDNWKRIRRPRKAF